MNILIVSIVAFVLNVPIGMLRHRYKKLSLKWWLLIHTSIPVIITFRILLDTPRIWIPLFIGLAILGQFTGARLYLFKKINK